MFRILVPAALVLTLAACIEDVGKDKVAAEISEPAPAAEQKAQVPEGSTVLSIDTSKSRLNVLGAKVTEKHEIDFPVWEGQVKVAGDQVVGLDFSADIMSLVADHPKLTTHLKNEDFFDGGNHPKATFVSSEIKAAEAGAETSHVVSGDLTVRGNTKRISFPANIKVMDGEIQANTQFVIDRQDFGVTYPGRPDDLVQDNVVITVEWVAPKG